MLKELHNDKDREKGIDSQDMMMDEVSITNSMNFYPHYE